MTISCRACLAVCCPVTSSNLTMFPSGLTAVSIILLAISSGTERRVLLGFFLVGLSDVDPELPRVLTQSYPWKLTQSYPWELTQSYPGS
uniref:Uncharacterized protein n=1 Tax=Ciona intestinalis TaxID=7719 RepID=F6YV21_CIOIN